MPYYKDPSNGVHFLDSEDYIDLLPKDCSEISDDEAKALLQSATKEDPITRLLSIDAKLAEIDAKGARPSRDIAAAIAAGQSAPAAAVQKLADLEAQAGLLIAERKTLTT